MHFYIINTTDIEYQASYILSNELLNENISVRLLNSRIPAGNIDEGEELNPSTSEIIILILEVVALGMTAIDLSDITISIMEAAKAFDFSNDSSNVTISDYASVDESGNIVVSLSDTYDTVTYSVVT